MNELLNNFMNQIDDVNRVRDMTIEEFTKLVKSNQLISEGEAKQLIESFKKISNKKNSEDESSDSDQRKKRYKQQHKVSNTKSTEKKEKTSNEKEKEDSKER